MARRGRPTTWTNEPRTIRLAGPMRAAQDGDAEAYAALPAVLMVMMLRRGIVLAPGITAAYGGLAAGALGHLGTGLFHLDNSSVIVLVWHCGTVLALSALAAFLAGPLLSNLSRGRFEYLLRGGTR